MKVDFLRKAKWYIVGFILIAVMLSVSLSFSAWDSLSFKAIMNANGGDFVVKPPGWDDYIKGENGETLKDVPALGSIVQYGRFYQDADALDTHETDPLLWRVVNYNAETKVATLLTNQIVSRGNFWGIEGASDPERFLNDYYRSTVRSWLNSGKGSLIGGPTDWKDSERYNDNVRNDKLNDGKPFGINESQVNQGFLDVAFSGEEKTVLVPRKFTGKPYIAPVSAYSACYTYGDSPDKSIINDLVWIPSFKELYNDARPGYGGPAIDGAGDSQFQYFAANANSAKVVSSTDYAWKADSTSYYNNGGGRTDESTQADATWWLRSPYAIHYTLSLISFVNGIDGHSHTYLPSRGVRPAVNVQL